jgi:hypothetical protein
MAEVITVERYRRSKTRRWLTIGFILILATNPTSGLAAKSGQKATLATAISRGPARFRLDARLTMGRRFLGCGMVGLRFRERSNRESHCYEVLLANRSGISASTCVSGSAADESVFGSWPIRYCFILL